jgi:hypothetical protein
MTGPEPPRRPRPDPDPLPEETARKFPRRRNGRSFKSGDAWTGNKHGRPAGSAAHHYAGGPRVIAQLVQRLRDVALGDDIPNALKAAAILGPWLVPRAKSEAIEIELDLPELTSIGACQEALAMVTQKIAARDLSADDAATVISAINAALAGFARGEIEAMRVMYDQMKAEFVRRAEEVDGVGRAKTKTR